MSTASVAGLHLKVELDIASPDAFIITSITDPAHDISLIVRPGHVVRVAKEGMDFLTPNFNPESALPPVVNLSLFLEGIEYSGVLAAFGSDIAAGEWMDVVLQPLLDQNGILWEGCEPYQGIDTAGRVPLVLRGSCMFVDKARYAEEAGAIGLIVVARDNRPFTMSSSSTNVASLDLDDGTNIPVMMVGISFLRHILSMPYDKVEAMIGGPKLNDAMECGVSIDSESQLSHLYKADTYIQFNNMQVRNFDVVLALSGRERRVLKGSRKLANQVSGVLDSGQGVGCAGGCVADTTSCCRDIVGSGVGKVGPSKASYARTRFVSARPSDVKIVPKPLKTEATTVQKVKAWWDWWAGTL